MELLTEKLENSSKQPRSLYENSQNNLSKKDHKEDNRLIYIKIVH